MGNQRQWADWIPKLPALISGLVSLVAAVISLVLVLRGNYHLGIVVLVTLVVVALLGLCLYLAFARTPPLVPGGRGVYRFEQYRPWAFLGIGLIVGLVSMTLLNPRIRLFLTVAFGTTTPTATFTPSPTNTPVPTSTSVPVNTPLPVVPVIPTPRPPCPYQASTDAGTIVALIKAEEKAVLTEDIAIVRAIFAPDATIRDAARGDSWDDPVARYETLFANTDFIEAVHFEIQPADPGIAGNVAYYTSGSKVKFRSVDDLSKIHEFENEGCSDHWTFGRDTNGCWVIIDFTFNACLVPFPP